MNEIKKYHNILNNKEIDFLKKYAELPEIERQKYIGYFNGLDFCSKDIYKFSSYYSIFNHSLSTANMTYHFTQGKGKLREKIGKIKTISSFLHNIATPATSNTEDYRNKDYLEQDYTKNIYDIINNSKAIKECLEEDMIDIEDVVNSKRYSIVDSKIPMLSTDRLDGIFINNYLDLKTITLNEIKEIYENLIIVENEFGEEEIGTKDKNIARKIAHLSLNVGYNTLNKIFAMEFLANIVNLSVDYGFIVEDELKIINDYQLFSKISQIEVKEIKDLWYTFTHMKKINVEKDIFRKLKGHYYVKYNENNIEKRYVDPLVLINNNSYCISQLDDEIDEEIDKFKRLNNEYYAYTKILRR